MSLGDMPKAENRSDVSYCRGHLIQRISKVTYSFISAGNKRRQASVVSVAC